MPFFLITAMTSMAVIAFVWLIGSSQHTNLYSLRNLFLAAWLYYGFSVGIDLMTGAEIPYTAGEIYMMDAANWGSVAFVMLCYSMCGIAFMATYFVMQGSRDFRPLKLQYSLRTPPEWCLVLLHILAAYVYVQVFFGMDRMERLAMAQQHVSYKFATLVVPITLAMDVLVILSGKARKSLVAIFLALMLSLLTGNRSYVLFIFLVGAFHWQPKLRGWKLVGMVVSCSLMVFTFKTLYAVGLDWWRGGRVDASMIYENLRFTFAGLDADASYAIAMFYTGQASPLWLGKSYVQTPLLLSWPRFLGGADVTTLAENYVWTYHIATAERGGALAFSAIAEAWLNFSYIGPLLLGIFWGVVANVFDRLPRGVAYYIVLLMIARLFRSDAASLFKNWVIVWGTMFVLAMTLLTIYTAIVEPRRAPLGDAIAGRAPPNKPPEPGLGGSVRRSHAFAPRSPKKREAMKPLRICHVIHNTEVGGAETMLFRVLQQLAAQHEMSVVSLMGCGEIGRKIQRLGVSVHALECVKDRRPRPARLAGLVRQLRQQQPDVVQTWTYHADLCGGLAARMATRSAVVWNIRHATLDPSIDSKNVLRSARACGRISKWVPDRILLNANAALGAHAAAGYDRSKMQVLPNGFDLDRFRPLPEERLAVRQELGIPLTAPVLGMCGRFHPHKGQADFVKVAERIASDWPEAHFLIAGHECEQSNRELTTWIENTGSAHCFHLLGPRHDIPRILNAMDVYLLSSVTEGMPNVVGEAMACGVSVVATDVGDARYLMSGCGTVVPRQDVPAMTAAVGELLGQSEDERTAHGERARRHIANHFEIGVIASRYAQTWQEVLDQRDSRGRMSRLIPVFDRRTIFTSTSSTSGGGTGYRPKLVHVTTVPMTPWLFLRGQNRFMTQQGFNVHVISSPGPYMAKLRDRDPVTTHEVAISRHITPLKDTIAAWRLFRLFRKLRPEIVQLSTPKAALLGAVAAKAAGVPVRIYQVRGLSSESESGLRRTAYQRLERITARLCNGFLVNANSLLDYAQGAKILAGGFVAGMGMSNGIDRERFDPTMVMGADLQPWDHTEGEWTGPVIGYIGRLTRDKGLEDLFAAWCVLRDEFANARLLLVGPWESENAVSQSCRDGLRSDPRVIMPGTQDDVVSFYKRMDLFVFPSHGTEGFPNAPMEAAAMGLPVIATRVVGCVDAVVNEVTGKIISPRSPSELEAAMRAYLSDAELRVQHGQAGRARIRSGFDPLNLWSEFRDYYFYLMRRERVPLPILIDDQPTRSAA